MPGFVAKGAAPLGKVQEIARINSPGTLKLVARNLGDYEVLLSFLRHGGESDRVVYAEGDTLHTQLVSSGESLSTPVKPRTLVLTSAGKPTLYDRDGDGKLRILRTLGAPLASSPAVPDGVTSIPATKQFTAASGGFVAKGIRAGDILQITNGKDAGKYTITSRDSATQVTVRERFPVGSLTAQSWAIYPADTQVGTLDYFTGLVSLDYPSGDAPGAKAKAKGTCTFPVALDAGMTLIVSADTGGGGTATWDAAAAVYANALAYFATLASETFKVQVGTGAVQTITMGTEANPVDAVAKINGQLVDAVAARDLGNSTHANVTNVGNFPRSLNAGDTLTGKIDGGGVKTATWDAEAALLEGAGGAFAALAGETFQIKVDADAGWTTVTMGVEADIDAAVATIEAAISALGIHGGHAVKKDANNVNLTSLTLGTSSRVQTQNVAAGITTKLGIQNNGDDAGAGDVADITAVSQAEFKAVLEEDWKTAIAGDLVTVSNEALLCKITETTSTVGWYSYLEIVGGTGRAALGFTAAVTRGQDKYTITSDMEGTGALVTLSSVAAGITTKLGFSAGHAHGTGDVVDIDAVTYAEFASRIVTDLTTVTPNLETGNPVLISGSAETGATSTIQVTGGTAAGVFGFAGTAHAGDDPDAELGVLATYETSATVTAGTSGAYAMTNFPNEEIIVSAIGRNGNSQVAIEYGTQDQRI